MILFIIELFKQENVHIYIFLACFAVLYIFKSRVGCSCIDQLERALGRAHTFAYHKIGH